MLSFLAALILMAVPAPLTIEVSKAPTQPGLPEYVQEMSAEDYEAWAYWQNAISREKTARANRFADEQATYTVDRWVTSSKSSMKGRGFATGRASNKTRAGKNNRRSSATTNVHTGQTQSGRQSTVVATIPTRYKNPYYCPKSLMVYNPTVKSTSERRPDWDNLYVPWDGGVITVTEALKCFNRPMTPEKMFRMVLTSLVPE